MSAHEPYTESLNEMREPGRRGVSRQDQAAPLDILLVHGSPETAGALEALGPSVRVTVSQSASSKQVLEDLKAKPCALVLTEAATARARSLVELMGVPAVAEATGIYNWAGDGDVALVDGDHGLVRVNPSRRERDLARAERDEDDG